MATARAGSCCGVGPSSSQGSTATGAATVAVSGDDVGGPTVAAASDATAGIRGESLDDETGPGAAESAEVRPRGVARATPSPMPSAGPRYVCGSLSPESGDRDLGRVRRACSQDVEEPLSPPLTALLLPSPTSWMPRRPESFASPFTSRGGPPSPRRSAGVRGDRDRDRDLSREPREPLPLPDPAIAECFATLPGLPRPYGGDPSAPELPTRAPGRE